MTSLSYETEYLYAQPSTSQGSEPAAPHSQQGTQAELKADVLWSSLLNRRIA